MPATERCELCEFDNPPEARNFGFDVCSPCAAGHVRDRMQAWAAQVEVEEFLIAGAEDKALSMLAGNLKADGLDAESAIRVTVRLGNVDPLMAKFRNQTFGSRVRNLFSKRMRSGDPLFDARVAFETKTPARLQHLLANDGFQSAVMSLATHCGAFEVTANGLEVVAPLSDFDLRAEIPLAACALMRRVARD